MIKSFTHKGIENLFYTGNKKGIKPEHAGKLEIILDNAPGYTKSKIFYSELNKIPVSEVINQIQNRPVREIMWNFESIFLNRVLKRQINSLI